MLPSIKESRERIQASEKIQADAGVENEVSIQATWEAAQVLHGSKIAGEEQAGGLSIEERGKLACKRVDHVRKIQDLIEQQDQAGKVIAESRERDILNEYRKVANDLKDSRYANQAIGKRVIRAMNRIKEASRLKKALAGGLDREVAGIWDQANGLLENYEPVLKLLPKIKGSTGRVIAVDRIKEAANREDEEFIRQAWEATNDLKGSISSLSNASKWSPQSCC